VTWSIACISIATFQTFFIPFSLITWKKFEHKEFQKKTVKIIFSVVELILIVLALTAIIIPGIDQYPASYKETNGAMGSVIVFIIFYGILLTLVVLSIFKKHEDATVGNNQQIGPYSMDYRPTENTFVELPPISTTSMSGV